MSRILNEEIGKMANKSHLREIENLFLKLKGNSQSIKQENKQIELLRKANDKSFGRLKQAIENLRAY